MYKQANLSASEKGRQIVCAVFLVFKAHDIALVRLIIIQHTVQQLCGDLNKVSVEEVGCQCGSSEYRCSGDPEKS